MRIEPKQLKLNISTKLLVRAEKSLVVYPQHAGNFHSSVDNERKSVFFRNQLKSTII